MPNRWLILLIFVLTAGAVVVDMPRTVTISRVKLERPQIPGRDLEIKKGLDLAGGVQLILQADMDRINQADRTTALDALQDTIERRVNPNGVFESVIQTSRAGGDYRVIVELPGVENIDEAVALLGQPADLTFREEASGSAEQFGPFQKKTDLSGKDLQNARPSFNPQTGEPVIELMFNAEGTKKFEEITKKNLNKQLAIFLDDQYLMSPTVQMVIPDGKAIISGKFTAQQVKLIARQLNSGALPAPVKVLSQNTIPPTLGQDSINKSLVAGLVGLGIVALFMIANYGRLGFFADLALLIYALIVFAVFKLVPVTLTLAGIAGFILSIGMAVDANILVFERMREEIRWGRNRLAAMELGFTRAFPSIRDSNVSSLITCGILYWFGTGSVKGFALTLAIGIAVSLFTALTVTRTLLRLFIRK